MTTYAATDTPLDNLIEPEYAADATIQQRYETWIEANPWVLTRCERLIAEWFAAGHSVVGIGAAWEQIRWSYGTTTGDAFKANNSYRSRAARTILERHPEWQGRIRTRELRAA